MKRLCLSVAILVISLGAIEIYFRLTDKKPDLSNERNTLYRYDAELGWYPKPDYNGTFFYEPGQPVQVRHNKMGFRDVEHGPKQKPVLAILGDSYVYGFNVQQDERFSDLLQSKLPKWDIYNLGVSGFGTDQELLLINNLFQRIQPDTVLLIFCQNDHADSATNRRYGYYKPYFDVTQGQLELKGVPVPKSLLYYPSAYPWLFKSRIVTRLAEIAWRPIAKAHWPTVRVPDPTGPLLQKMREEVESHGAKFAIGFIGYGPDEKSFCKASRLHCFETDSTHVYTTPGGHWNAQGHREVANQIYQYVRSIISDVK